MLHGKPTRESTQGNMRLWIALGFVTIYLMLFISLSKRQASGISLTKCLSHSDRVICPSNGSNMSSLFLPFLLCPKVPKPIAVYLI